MWFFGLTVNFFRIFFVSLVGIYVAKKLIRVILKLLKTTTKAIR